MMGRSRAFPPLLGGSAVHRRRPNAPGQRKHPAQRRVSRLSSRISGNILLCGRKGLCTTISDRVCVAKRRCPRAPKRNTIIIGAAKPTLGSESRVSSGETAQACTARHQGGPSHHSYAWIPRGLRCGPWSGQEPTFGTWTRMGVFLDVICYTSVKDAASTAAYVGDVRQHLHRPPTGPGGSERAWHAVTPPWEH